jgi:DNA topoisomerase-3
MLYDTLYTIAIAEVVSIKKSETSRSRPTPLNTVNLLQHASKSLGMGPYTTMQIAERLYLQGYISYPRTESTSYPDSYDIRGTLSQHTSHAYWGNFVQELMNKGFQRPKKGVDVGDHPPITPVRVAQPTELSGDMARLYEFITRYFIATVSPDAKLLATKIIFICGGKEKFSVSGHQILSKGFTEIMTSTSLAENFLPEFNLKERLPLSTLRIRHGQTSPPGYLTESELIGLMEKNGIGTDASIPAHINNICERNYVQLGSGRTLVPTNLGIVLVHGYYRTDPELVLPKVRAAIEQQCTLIAKGIATKEDVLQHSLILFQKKFEYFVHKINLMDSLFEATFSPLAATGKPLSKCGKCLRYMKYVKLKPQRLHCATCNETYNLPQNGTIKLYKVRFFITVDKNHQSKLFSCRNYVVHLINLNLYFFLLEIKKKQWYVIVYE